MLMFASSSISNKVLAQCKLTNLYSIRKRIHIDSSTLLCKENINDCITTTTTTSTNKKHKFDDDEIVIAQSCGSNGMLLLDDSIPMLGDHDIVIYPQTGSLISLFKDPTYGSLNHETIHALKQQELKQYTLSSNKILQLQPKFDRSWRNTIHPILMDWVREVCHEFSFYRETFHYIVRLVNLLYCNLQVTQLDDIQLYAITAIWIIIKSEEYNTYTDRMPYSSLFKYNDSMKRPYFCCYEMAKLTGNDQSQACTGEKIKQTEGKILTAVNWRTIANTSYHWLNLYISYSIELKQKESDEWCEFKNIIRCYEYLDMITLFIDFIDVLPSIIGAIVLYIVHPIEHFDLIAKVSGYTFVDKNVYSHFISITDACMDYMQHRDKQLQIIMPIDITIQTYNDQQMLNYTQKKLQKKE